ncbi:MAG: carbohydrate binding domain-containing protein [Verrucomicrobiota bacterium]
MEFWERLLDAGHLPFFAVLAGLFFFLARAVVQSATRAAWLALAASVTIAAGIELIQPLAGRSASLTDFLNGVAGALLFGVGVAVHAQGGGRARLLVYLALCVIVTVAVFRPPWLEFKGILWRRANFPVLGDFETAPELRLWVGQGGTDTSQTRLSLSTNAVTRGTFGLRIDAAQGDWGGVTYSAGEMDWSSYSVLRFDLFNPGTAFRLGVRVSDDGDCSAIGKRFDRELEVPSGWTHVRITSEDIKHGPKNRLLNLRSIRRLTLFGGQNQPARTFYLDAACLE